MCFFQEFWKVCQWVRASVRERGRGVKCYTSRATKVSWLPAGSDPSAFKHRARILKSYTQVREICMWTLTAKRLFSSFCIYWFNYNIFSNSFSVFFVWRYILIIHKNVELLCPLQATSPLSQYPDSVTLLNKEIHIIYILIHQLPKVPSEGSTRGVYPQEA